MCVCVCEQVSVSRGDKNRKQDKIALWDEIKPLQPSHSGGGGGPLSLCCSWFWQYEAWPLGFMLLQRQTFMMTADIVLSLRGNSLLLTSKRLARVQKRWTNLTYLTEKASVDRESLHEKRNRSLTNLMLKNFLPLNLKLSFTWVISKWSSMSNKRLTIKYE